MGMTSMPGAVVEIAAEALEARLEGGEGGDGAANARVEEGVWPSPVGAEEAVGAVVGDGHGLDLDVPESAPELLDGRKERAVDGHERREVVVGEPEPWPRGIPGDENDATPRDPLELREPFPPIPPVMNGEHGERGREGGRAEGQSARRGLHHGGAARAALADHGEGGLHGDYPTVRRLIGSRACADIDHGICIAEGAHDRGSDAWIGPAIGAVAPADLVIEVPSTHVSVPPLTRMLSLLVSSRRGAEPRGDRDRAT